MHSYIYLEQRFKLYPKKDMQSTILYIKYIFKDTKIMFKLNLNNQSVSSTYMYIQCYQITFRYRSMSESNVYH